MTKRGLFWRLAGMLFACWLLVFPQIASAHAVLLEADPAPNSQLAVSPEQITLVFNERLEKELFYIRVYDENGRDVARTKTEMSLDQRTLIQKLPRLDDGVYTVSYHAISADGHPVEEAYMMTIGQPSNQTGALVVGQGGHQHGSIGLWANRFLYYLSLLFLTGWLFSGMLVSFAAGTSRKTYLLWLKGLKRFYLFMLLAVGFIQISALLGDDGLSGIGPLLFRTVFGQTWLFSILLTVAGWFLLGRNRWLDGVWGVLLLAAEGLNGHALTFEPEILAVSLDVTHLLAAAVWCGGLLHILVFWKRDRDRLRRFVLVFSQAAFASILLLAVSGMVLTLVFLPALSDLLATTWGILLLIKMILVVMVIMVAAILRRVLKKGLDGRFQTWFKMDFGFMLAIIFVVGGLTHTSPVPSNQPLFWQETQINGVSLTAAIQPNNPGVVNAFDVRIRMPEGESPKRVEMWLKHQGEPSIAPIRVPLTDTATEKGLSDGSRDNGHALHAEGPFFPVYGKWRVEVRVMDQDDHETVFEKEMILYQVKKS